MDGTSGRYPRWIRQKIANIATWIITNSVSAGKRSNENNKIDDIKSLITRAFVELETGKVNPEDLQFTVKICKEPENTRTKMTE